MTFLSVIEYGIVSYIHRNFERKKLRDEHVRKLKQVHIQSLQKQKEANKVHRLSIVQRIELEPKSILRKRRTNCN